MKYERFRKLKRELLERAFDNFHTQPNRKSSVEHSRQFCERNQAGSKSYSFFRVLMEINGESETWDEWKPEHRDPKTAQSWLARTVNRDANTNFLRREKFFCYVQWIADEQWRELSKFAEERGVSLSWATFHLASVITARMFSPSATIFHLDWSGGAPPEPYFKDDAVHDQSGDKTGASRFIDWPAMRRADFAWWRQRVRGVKRIFHIFRIDHVLGFYRIYAFPWRPARNTEFLPLTRDANAGENRRAISSFRAAR